MCLCYEPCMIMYYEKWDYDSLLLPSLLLKIVHRCFVGLNYFLDPAWLGQASIYRPAAHKMQRAEVTDLRWNYYLCKQRGFPASWPVHVGKKVLGRPMRIVRLSAWAEGSSSCGRAGPAPQLLAFRRSVWMGHRSPRAGWLLCCSTLVSGLLPCIGSSVRVPSGGRFLGLDAGG